MKATGIVRRIDDLGRIVIPKEIRRAVKIREGDPMEIFLDNDGGVVFRKYNLHDEINFKAIYEAMRISGLRGIIVNPDGTRIAGVAIPGLDIPNDVRDIRYPETMESNPNYLMYPVIIDSDLYAVIIVNQKSSPNAREIVRALAAVASAMIHD